VVTRRNRRALAGTRKAAGFTQESLAEALGVDRSTVIRWEAGQHEPVPYLWPKFAELLGISRDQFAELLTIEERTSQSADLAVTWDDMRRRTLMKWGVATTAVAGLGVGAGTTVGLTDVRRLRDSAARLHGLDQRHGGETIWRAALDHAQEGMSLLEHGSYNGIVERQLLAATGRLQVCAGWLALDAGEHQVARACLGEALVIGRQARDPIVETRALANLAFQANLLSRPREAQRFALGAEQAATGAGAPAWLAAIPQLRLAMSSARTGNAQDVDRAIGRAYGALERDDDTAGEAWAVFLSPLEIAGNAASCAMELGRAAEAERLLEPVIAGYEPRLARNLATWRVRLALARLDQGAVDGAVETAHAVLDDLAGDVASWRVTTKLDAIATRLAAFPHVPEASAFVERYRAA
jgi:transcriptional regulator with XRE-family HTH domain/tetratricopeptide (TPR) repeat protein